MKKLLSFVLAALLVLGLTACGQKPAELTEARVYVLSGPTGIGAVNMMKASEKGNAEGIYNFNVVAQPDEIVSKISNGEADIAAVATNLAAKLYNKTGGGVTVLAVNTLGVLNVLTNSGTTVTSLADLKDKTVYTTGQGSNPEYIIDYLLSENGINPDSDLNLQFKAEGTELVGVWATDPNAGIIAPQPVATSIVTKYEGSKIAIDLTDEWEKLNNGSALMQGCVIVRNEFLKNNAATVEKFLEEYEASINTANSDVDTTAALCEEYGIVAKAAVAKKAIPGCNICFVSGDEMKTKLSGFLSVMLAADASSIGGKLPADDFYYAK